MKLAEPKSAQDNDHLVDLAKSKAPLTGNSFWIGIDDKSQEGTFTYASDGYNVFYTNWKVAPDNHNGIEHCVHIHQYGPTNWKWNDYPCHKILSFICEAF